MAVKRTTRTVEVAGWAGSEGDVIALLRYASSLFEMELQTAEVELLEETAAIERRDYLNPEQRERRIAEARSAHRRRLKVTFRAEDTYTNETVSGDVIEILGASWIETLVPETPGQLIDIRSFKSLHIFIPSLNGDRSVRLVFNTLGSGVVVEGALSWAEGVRAGYKAELKRRQQWWSWLRWQNGAITAALLYYIVSFLVVSPFITDSASLWQRTLLTNGLAFAAVILFWVYNRTILPPFEFLREGAKSKATAWLMWCGGVMGAAAINAIFRAVER